jgi:D-3-phosphoglycerate dehydrogenase / 2-oxoglutarate reductase
MKLPILVTNSQMIDYLSWAGHNHSLLNSDLFVFECHKSPSGFSAEKLLNLLNTHVAIIVGDDFVTEEVLVQNPQLRIVVKWGSGFDTIDVQACKRLGIAFENTPGLLGDSVADLAVNMFLSVIRGSNLIDNSIRNGNWLKITGYQAKSFDCGIIGYGAIGKEVSKRLLGFDCSVSVFDPFIDASGCSNVRYVNSLDQLIRSCNAIFVCVPLSDSTLGLLSRDKLRFMKKGSVLINISRGKVVDQSALEEMLESGYLLGAGLDVFEIEPLPIDCKLRSLNNVMLSSHNASNTYGSIRNVSEQCLKILNSYLITR